MLQTDNHGCTPLYSAAMAINPSPKVAGLLVDAMWKHADEEMVMNSHVYRSYLLQRYITYRPANLSVCWLPGTVVARQSWPANFRGPKPDL